MDIKVREEDVILLSKLKSIEDPFRRQLAIASVITKVFVYNNLSEPVMVGGSVVALYTREFYKTFDLDLKSESVEEYNEILKELGYSKIGKDFYNVGLDSYVEFPSGVMGDSWNHVREFEVEETGLPIFVIGFEDIVLDRLSSYVATRDNDSREWALRLIAMLYKDIDWAYMHKRANDLNILKQVERAQRDVKRHKQLYDLMRDETSSTNSTTRMRLF